MFIHHFKFRLKQKNRAVLIVVCFKKIKFNTTQASFIWKKDGTLDVFDKNSNK